MTFASRFRFICWIVILSMTSIGIATSQSQKSNSFTSEAVQLVRQLHDVKQLRRSAAFYLLIEKGLGQALAGRTYLIPQALTQLFRNLPDKEDEIKAALVELLEKENALIQDQHTDFLATGKSFSQEHMDYYGDLIAAVAALKDPRAINGLLGAIATGNLATRGLAALGIDALPLVLEKLKDGDIRIRSAATRVCLQMAELSGEGKIQLPSSSREDLKIGLVKSTQDENHYVRMSAIDGLAELVRQGDSDVLALIERIAQDDPYNAQAGRKNGSYPVREAAQRALQSLKTGIK